MFDIQKDFESVWLVGRRGNGSSVLKRKTGNSGGNPVYREKESDSKTMLMLVATHYDLPILENSTFL